MQFHVFGFPWPLIMDAHYKACLYAGINTSGINGEVMSGLEYMNLFYHFDLIILV
jgi:hypothetical protein